MTGPAEHADDGTVRTARVLPVRSDGRVLLLRGADPDRPDAPFWFSVGGHVEPGETLERTAVRELREETGLVVSPGDVTAALGTHRISYGWRGEVVERDATFFAVAVPDDVEPSLAGLTASETGYVRRAGWLSPDELAATGENRHGGLLLAMVRAAVAAVFTRSSDAVSPSAAGSPTAG